MGQNLVVHVVNNCVPWFIVQVIFHQPYRKTCPSKEENVKRKNLKIKPDMKFRIDSRKGFLIILNVLNYDHDVFLEADHSKRSWTPKGTEFEHGALKKGNSGGALRRELRRKIRVVMKSRRLDILTKIMWHSYHFDMALTEHSETLLNRDMDLDKNKVSIKKLLW